MCCRFHLSKRDYREMLVQLGVVPVENHRTRYNIAPGGEILVVRNASQTAAREAVPLRWGLTPAWAKSDDPAARLVNARAETLTAKPSFRDAFRARRCIVPASGFFEWEVVGRTRRPWLFRRHDESPFGLAGIWETWRGNGGERLESCAIITTAPNALMRPIHHRMPAMLTHGQIDAWLDLRLDLAQLAPLLAPAPAETLHAFPVNPSVSNVHHDAPDCLEPAGSAQLSFGL